MVIEVSAKRGPASGANKTNTQEFLVIVSEGDSKTQHTVTLENAYWEDLTQRRMTKEELIKKSFEFLLKRESKQSILSRFNLRVIGNYFPDFEEEIKSKE